jgi:8-oxo-dGTP diphosphatase
MTYTVRRQRPVRADLRRAAARRCGRPAADDGVRLLLAAMRCEKGAVAANLARHRQLLGQAAAAGFGSYPARRSGTGRMSRVASADEHRPVASGTTHPPAPGLAVVAAAVIEQGRLLVVSKQAAPDVFYLPGGTPGPGETARETLVRELRAELGAWPAALTLLGQFDGTAALEEVPMRMTVFAASLSRPPAAAAELAALGWTTGADDFAPRLAPAVRQQVIPFLYRTGRLPAG